MLFFASLEDVDLSHKKVADAFPSYGQKFILQEGFAGQVFSNQKKGNFQGQILNVIFFPLLMGSQPYLQGIITLRRPFRKKKCLGLVIFVKIPIFSKIMVKNGGSEISGRCQKIFKKNNLYVHSFMLPKFRFHSAFS